MELLHIDGRRFRRIWVKMNPYGPQGMRRNTSNGKAEICCIWIRILLILTAEQAKVVETLGLYQVLNDLLECDRLSRVLL